MARRLLQRRLPDQVDREGRVEDLALVVDSVVALADAVDLVVKVPEPRLARAKPSPSLVIR